jgi:hypothetical protein
MFYLKVQFLTVTSRKVIMFINSDSSAILGSLATIHPLLYSEQGAKSRLDIRDCQLALMNDTKKNPVSGIECAIDVNAVLSLVNLPAFYEAIILIAVLHLFPCTSPAPVRRFQTL